MPGSQVSTRSQPAVGLARAVGDDHHAGVQRVADADAAAVVHRHPGRAGRGVQQGVQQRPVGDRVAAVAHAFGLAVGRRHRAGVEVIAADDDRRRDTTLAHQLVEPQPEARALAVAEPEDARRQSLERDALLRQPDPAAQRRVVGEHLERGLVGGGDVGRIARQRRPAERALALAEERPHVLGHEPRNVEGVGDAGALRLGADVVAVVEHHRAAALAARASPSTCRPIARDAAGLVARGSVDAQRRRLGQRQAVGHVAAEGVVRRGLIGDHVGRDAARDERRQHLGGVGRTARSTARRRRASTRRSGPARRRASRWPRRGSASRDGARSATRIDLDRPGRRRRSWSRPAAGRRPCRRGRR